MAEVKNLFPAKRSCQRVARFEMTFSEAASSLSAHAVVDGDGKRWVEFYGLRMSTAEARDFAGLVKEAAATADIIEMPELRFARTTAEELEDR